MQNESYLLWLFHALGFRYSVLLSAAGLLSFVLTLIVVRRGKGPLAGAALLFIVPLPFFIGSYSVLDAVTAVCGVLAASTTAPTSSELARGIGMSLASLWVGMLLAAPGYLVAMLGLFQRSLAENSDRSPPEIGP
ncbi:MAG TPA: hypothetical protein VN699_01410 [Pirellulales bacterium]|nr:hypothetical protein [Pirellulales bacterium]